ncbi:cell envelope integrity protein TolA [Kitasatospora sp. NPDC048407]|uniref:cell envelope integrity protein TolA n=1 Tax=Kitasatospora sp. NPDC048407 TaxID=3364051 RepID=UPI003716D251
MRLLPSSGRHRRAVGVFAAGALLLTSLVAQSGTAFAAAGGSSDAAKPAAEAPRAGGPEAKAEPKAEPKAAPKPDPQAEHQAAAKALQESDPTGACPAELDPKAPVTCTMDGSGTASSTLNVTQDHDLVLFQVLATQQYSLTRTLTAPDGSTVACENVISYASGAFRCATGQAGTYTLNLTNAYGANSISVAYLPLLSTGACRTVAGDDSKLGTAKSFSGSLGTGAVGDCYTTDLAPGDLLRTYGPNYQATWTVYDGTGKRICDSYTTGNSSSGLDCALTGTAPYRATVQQVSGQAVNYTFAAARLSRPEGCATVEPQAYGEAPDLTSTTRCRTLRVAADGRYQYSWVNNSGTYLRGRLFRTDGTLDSCQSTDCTLTAGDHTWVLDGDSGDVGAYGMTLRSATETRGCTATPDDGFASGAVTGTFDSAGQARCLTLPTASGKGLYVLNRPPTDGAAATVEIDDAGGVKQCDNGGYGYAACKLTGTAPFRAVLTAGAGKPYGVIVHRTDSDAGCTAWPQSGYGGSWGTEVSLNATDPQRCLSIPADQHAPAEMLDYANNLNQVNASVSITDGTGAEVCSTQGSSTTTCRFTPGTSYTAVLAGGQTDTYKMVRRDISPSAPCTTRSSTAVGGPSTPFDFTSALDARCVRITGAATDKFWLTSRTTGNRYEAGTLLMAVDADGKVQCRQWGVSCKMTGSTSYVALVVASGYQGKAVHANVDAWKVGGADGWAPECNGNVLSANGFPQHSGMLTETDTAYCGVIDLKAGQGITVAGTTSNAGPFLPPWLAISGPNEWTDSYNSYQCFQNYGQFGGACTNWSSTDGRALLMVTPDKSPTPVEYTVQGLAGGSRPDYGTPQTIAPATGRAGTLLPAVIRGTGLTMGSKIKLSQSSTNSLVWPQSVNADGTVLNVLVDTRNLAPGKYDLLRDGMGYTPGQASPGYVPNAFEVTAADTPVKSRFVPLTSARLLDTRDGTGAPKARIGAGQTTSLQVTGANGVPATGVTSVVLNVTAVDPSEDGHLTAGQSAVPSLTFAAHRTTANQLTVPVVNGKTDLRNDTGTLDLVADLAGYYTDATDQGSALTPITPARFLDTRDGTGAPKARIGAGQTAAVQVTGIKGVPADGVTAVVMNVTAVSPTATGWITAHADGQPLPGTSNLNFTPGRTVSNLVTVPVVNGKVDLHNSAGTVDLIADVTGYYSATGTSTFSPATPLRLLDTRDGTGARQGTVGAGGIVSFQVGGVDGVPYGATAVLLNVTATDPTATGYLTAYPHGTDRPGTSSLNYVAGQTVSHQVLVPVVDGRVVFYNSTGNVNVTADLTGWFAA